MARKKTTKGENHKTILTNEDLVTKKWQNKIKRTIKSRKNEHLVTEKSKIKNRKYGWLTKHNVLFFILFPAVAFLV